MNEHTSKICRRFSAREWERAELLGFDVPEFGRVAIANGCAPRADEDVRDYQYVEHCSIAVLLIRGAIRLRMPSVRKAAARLGMPWRVVRQRMHAGATVNGWRVRRAA